MLRAEFWNHTAFSNLAGGVIEVREGSGGVRTIGGDATLTNFGTITIEPTTSLTWSNSNSIFEIEDGSIEPDGEFVFSNGTIVLSGGVINENLIARSIDIEVEASATAPNTLVAQGSCTLINQDSPQTTIWVQGSDAGSTATLNTVDNLVNSGEIRLESIDSTYTSRITLPSGTDFVNAPTGVIRSRFGSGGLRSITGSSGRVINEGLIHVENNADLSMTAGDSVLEHVGGSIVADSEFLKNSGSFLFTGGSVEGKFVCRTGVVIEVHDTVSVPSTIIVNGSNTLSTNASPDVTIWVQGSSVGSTATLTMLSNSVNAGTILLRSINTASTSQLTVPGNVTFTNMAGATIDMQAGSGGIRDIDGAGTVINQGALTVGTLTNSTMDLTGTFRNEGMIVVETGANMVAAGGGHEFEQAQGTIVAEGVFLNTSGSFDFLGGQLTGEVIARACDISVESTVTEESQLIVQGSCELQVQDAPAVTLWVQGSDAGSTASLNVVDDLVNRGTIRLESIDSSYTSRIVLPANSLFINGPTGRIEALTGTSGARDIEGAGTLRNEGDLIVGSGTKLTFDTSGNELQQANGTIVAEGVFEMRNGSLELTGGSLSGEVSAFNTQIDVADTVTLPSVLLARGGSNTLLNNNSPDVTIWIQGSTIGSTATLTTDDDAVNAGTILLASIDSNFTTQIVVPVNEVFTNLSSGTIRSEAGTGGARNINGSLVNQGLLHVGEPLPLAMTGDFTQTSTGTLSIEFESVFDRFSIMSVSGDATLDGGIDITVLPNFDPPSGSEYTVLTAASVIGTFDAVESCDALSVAYTTDEVIVTFGKVSGLAGDLTGDGEVDTLDLLLLLGAWGVCPDPEIQPCCVGDINEDGIVGTNDLLLLLANWS